MGGLRRRLEVLEDRVTKTREDGFGEFLRALTDDELRWLVEPLEDAESRVPCPKHGGECGCSAEGRARRGIEAFPELAEDYIRRRQELISFLEGRV
jgi:hypothetical protein